MLQLAAGGFGGARKHGMMMGDETKIRNWP
jgi:hypothetical protein